MDDSQKLRGAFLLLPLLQSKWKASQNLKFFSFKVFAISPSFLLFLQLLLLLVWNFHFDVGSVGFLGGGKLNKKNPSSSTIAFCLAKKVRYTQHRVQLTINKQFLPPPLLPPPPSLKMQLAMIEQYNGEGDGWMEEDVGWGNVKKKRKNGEEEGWRKKTGHRERHSRMETEAAATAIFFFTSTVNSTYLTKVFFLFI